jgi:hypothetical protein
MYVKYAVLLFSVERATFGMAGLKACTWELVAGLALGCYKAGRPGIVHMGMTSGKPVYIEEQQ